MKELLETIIKPLVSHPEAISIEETEQGKTVVLHLTVAPDDMGKVIGALKQSPDAGQIDFGAASKLVQARLP